VFLDVVYNHLGPEGNYLSAFSPYYFSDTQTPWGKALNFDGPHRSMVRQFFIENALHWVHEYHVDGLRLDATHAIVDHDPRPFIAQLAARVRESAPRRVYVIAEDHRNLARMIRPEGEGGWGLDGVWADDFHHKVRVALAGDREGYYRDYTGSMPNLARTLNQGWHFTGQYSSHLQEHRGTDPSGISPRRFVFCIQNHDQVGNRALGERLHHQIELAAYRAASVLLLCAPATPLLFMGQEWAATTPFLYFTDHPAALGRLVTEGRRNEFRHFSAFSAAEARARIPDPQDEETFLASRLEWSQATREPHASTLRLYQRLLALRRREPAVHCERFAAFAPSASTLLLRQDAAAGPSLLAIIEMHGSSAVNLADHECLAGLDGSLFQLLFTTEDRPFAPDPRPPVVAFEHDQLTVVFSRPSAVLLSVWPRGTR
jgi:maltooligosyltrehalose trehalohydrolase